MKKFLFFFLMSIFFSVFVSAQSSSLLDIDINFLDSIFDEPSEENLNRDTDNEYVAPVLQNLRRRGLAINASYDFMGGINPGWTHYPWEDHEDNHFSWAIGLRMSSSFGITAQISEVFRVISSVTMAIPGFVPYLGDLFFAVPL